MLGQEQARMSGAPDDARRYHELRRSGRVSVAVNLVLTVAQIAVGVLAHAQSLIADAIHTLSDLLADFLVLWASRQSSHPADSAHPYGHRRIETAASLGLGTGLAVVGIGILLAAADRIRNVEALPPIGAMALWMALITLVAKELLFRYILRIAERTRSPMLIANAWHARSDAASSLVVAVGIGASLAGYRFLDPLAAALVAFMIIRMGFKFAYEALQELVDTSLSAEKVERIRATLLATPGVIDLHELRTRRMAHRALVDAHVRVDPRISVSEGHRIAESARSRVVATFPEVLDVLVHVDAEDDTVPEARTANLPDRATLLRHLRALLGDEVPQLDKAVFHYLGSRVEVEVFLPPEYCLDPENIARVEERIAAALPRDTIFSAISINCRFAPRQGSQ
jgi:cation diffusion facilitator family transporter